MKKDLTDAISSIEEAGGFVMFPEDSAEERNIRQQTHILEQKKLQEEEALEAEIKSDYEQRKKEAFKDFDKMLGKPGFSFNGVSDLCYEHGIDLDDIEEYINGYY